jgi:hypothetical protein
MKTKAVARLEDGRIRHGPYRSDTRYGCTGMFMIQGPCGAELAIMASEGDDEFPWEHVSVSTQRRPPNWEEMCFVKDLFWNEEEVVMQLHPSKSEYVNYHPHCLHMWRPTKAEIPLPPSILVGPKNDAQAS